MHGARSPIDPRRLIARFNERVIDEWRLAVTSVRTNLYTTQVDQGPRPIRGSLRPYTVRSRLLLLLVLMMMTHAMVHVRMKSVLS